MQRRQQQQQQQGPGRLSAMEKIWQRTHPLIPTSPKQQQQRQRQQQGVALAPVMHA
jgi:hypothetical protein